MSKITQIIMGILALFLCSSNIYANEIIDAANAYNEAINDIKHKAYEYHTAVAQKKVAYKVLKIAYKDTITKANALINQLKKSQTTDQALTLSAIQSIKKFTTEIMAIVKKEKLCRKANKLDDIELTLIISEELDKDKKNLAQVAQESLIATNKFILALKK